MKRRDFLELGAAMAALGSGASARAQSADSSAASAQSVPEVDFVHDGRRLGAADYARLLMRLADEGRVRPDYYSNGGVVEELEARFARLLGHETAVFMPTGTLANHLAVRRLAGERRRVVVPAESHLCRDSGDCAQVLSHLNLMPLAPGRACFGADELAETVRRSGEGRVPTPVGAVLVETPVRRMLDRIVRDEGLAAINAEARRLGVGTHLDGARLFVQSVHTGTSPASYGEMFDTVYTSLWKCFSAPSGAVLAGSRNLMEGLFHERRMFGGGLPHAWPFAAVALHYADRFTAEYGKALQRAQMLMTSLQRSAELRFEVLDEGTDIVRLALVRGDPARFQQALRRYGVQLPMPQEGVFHLRINPTLADAPPDIETRFEQAAREAA